MTDSLAAPAVHAILAKLEEMRGQPVRVTIKDSESQERLLRVQGVLAGVAPSGLKVECLQSQHALLANAPATVEILAQGQLFWCHTRVQEVFEDGWLNLLLPSVIQTVQRRCHPRVDLDAPVHLVVKDQSRAISGLFRDLSAGGAALHTTEPVSVGERVKLVFALGSGLFLQDLEAEIVRCTEGPDGTYLVALHFRCPEQEDALATWVNRQLAGGTDGGAGAG